MKAARIVALREAKAVLRDKLYTGAAACLETLIAKAEASDV